MEKMHRLLKLLFVGIGLFAATANGYSWGQKGHDVTCEIARRHLTKKAGKKISAILDGKSIVYWANWMDNASHTKEYKYTSTWHYKNLDADETFENAQLAEKGDVVRAVEEQIAALKSGKLSKEEEALSLKFLVHMVGDLHCPMHMGHRSDRGGNTWQVRYFGKGKNLHSVWDSGVIESAHKWSYNEWADQTDVLGKKENAAIMQGTPASWAKENYEISKSVYEETPVGSKLSYDYVSRWSETVELQLLRGGLRLAAILNEIFG